MKLFRHKFKPIQLLIFVWFVPGLINCVNTQQQLGLEKIESKPYSGIVSDDLEFMVISDKDKFHEIYKQIRSVELPRPSPPPVDFNSYRVLIAFMGRKSTAGYSIDFYNVVLQGNNEIKVKVILNSPQRGAVLAQVTTSPYAIAKVAKGNYESAKFVDEEKKVLRVVKVGIDP